MKKFIFVLILNSILILGCKKTEVEMVNVLLTLNETQCANPWDALPSSDNYLTEVKNYLEAQDITVYIITVERLYNAPIYGGCSILSGRIIKIKIPESDIKKAESVGFVQPE